MPVPTEVAQSSDWLSLRKSAEMLGRSPVAVMRLVVLGQVEVKNEPGRTPKYRRSDVERVAQQSRPRAVGAEARV